MDSECLAFLDPPAPYLPDQEEELAPEFVHVWASNTVALQSCVGPAAAAVVPRTR